MTLEPDGDDPYASPVRPPLVGDQTPEGRIAGFAWDGAGNDAISTHLDDRLLLEGDQDLACPPDRRVPQTVDDTGGVMPPRDLPADQVPRADTLDAGIPAHADLLLDLPAAPWQPLARPLFAAVHATGHRIWLSGGSVRGLLTGEAARTVKDLDLSGTVPAGRFTDTARQTLRAYRMSEFRTTITPHTLVCAVVPPGQRTRLIEYRGLSQGGFRFPAVGSSLSEDARHRDFTFNALHYDTLGHRVFDGSGTGIRDLLGPARRFDPLKRPTDPVARAEILIRAAKFFVRWTKTDCDLTPFLEWVATFDDGWHEALGTRTLSRLTDDYEQNVVGPPGRHQEYLDLLPPQGRKLIEKLREAAR
ncbi:hypothetical protein [Amycolatopsis tucumanensis]|uniref:Poly A polymerase head domain-containing protein n=1 Tax=Amycolatopsis tucumanensis TaxID=401106 RepID=A0ABP7HCU8_9PSEU|nr:hypothetical protein [Amycolatopsis tucumanensis]MCF6423714.1 hypothetical protein [Amycolatopsis tucumanensis]